jgi:glycerol-3-phosphate dehydrogenase (NAD(P)+)
MARVGVIGAGAWGTAVGAFLADNGHEVELWSFEQDVADELNTRHTNSRYLADIVVNETVRARTDIRAVPSDKDFLILAVPSLHLLESVRAILDVPNIREGETTIGVLTKGFVHVKGRSRLIVETLEDYLPGFYKGNVVYISGPSHAEEVARGMLTGLISASQNAKNAIRFRRLFASESLKIFSSLDVVGVQVCAAVKNVIAVAFGILDAFKEQNRNFGDNTESLLLAAGLNEIQSVGQALGSTHPETFTSIAGVGDLDVTCRSHYGRNRRFGRAIVLENVLEEFQNINDLIDSIDKIGYLPEGVVAARATRQIAEERSLRLPIANAVYRILNRESAPYDQIAQVLRL